MSTNFLFTNNATSQLQYLLTADATELTVLPGTGVRFPQPDPTSDYLFSLTLTDKTGLLREIVYCTAVVGDVLTVLRGREGTDAQIWPALTGVYNLVTSAALMAAGTRNVAFNYYFSNGANASDSNDGLTPDTPLLTLQRGLTLASYRAMYSPGTFNMNIFGGNYNVFSELSWSRSIFLNSIVNWIGEVDTVSGLPLVHIFGSPDGTRNNSLFSASQGARMSISDVYISNFASAFRASQGGGIYGTRVYAVNCSRVFSVGNMGWADFTQGDWDGRDLNSVIIPDGTSHSDVIGSCFDLTQPDNSTALKIHHWDRGGVDDECGSGHRDFVTFEDCNIGLEVTRGAGASNLHLAKFRRCPIGILARNAPNLLVSNDQDFGQGTPDACGTNIVYAAGPTNPCIEDTNFDSRWLFKRAKTPGGVTTNTTDKLILWQPYSIVKARARERDIVVEFMLNGRFVLPGLTQIATWYLDVGGNTLATWTSPVGTTIYKLTGGLTASSSADVYGTLQFWQGDSTTTLTTQLIQINTASGLGVLSQTADTPVTVYLQLGALSDGFQTRDTHCLYSVAGITVPS